MMTYEEMIDRTRVCSSRLWSMERSFATLPVSFGFPESAEFMFLMDAVHRAQWYFERALHHAADEQQDR